MRRLRIEESSANKVTRNPTVNRLRVEFHDPIDVKRTSQKEEIDLFKQGVDTQLILCMTGIMELTIRQQSKDIKTIQTA